MQLDPSQITSARVALWSPGGAPITTVLVPQSLARQHFADPKKAEFEIDGIKFAVDHSRALLGGITTGDQLILDTEERRPRVIRGLLEKLQAPLSIEVVGIPAEGSKPRLGNAVVIAPEELQAFGKDATITSRDKFDHQIYTLTFQNLDKGLECLGVLKEAFKKIKALVYETHLGLSILDEIDAARKLSKERECDVVADFGKIQTLIPYGKPATANLNGHIFTVGPDEPAEEAYKRSLQKDKPPTGQHATPPDVVVGRNIPKNKGKG